MKLHLHFTRYGGEPRLERSEFWSGAMEGPPAAVLNALGTSVRGEKEFVWTNAVRAMAVLFLRAFATDNPFDFQLIGEGGSLARSLDEVLRAKHAKDKDGVPTWIQKMFSGSPTVSPADARLASSVLEHRGNSNEGGSFRVSLGRLWTQPDQFSAFLDGTKLSRESYVELANELEGAGRLAPLEILELSVMLGPAGKQQATLAEFQPLAANTLPAQNGQRLRIVVRASREAFIYVCWITPKGIVEVAHPRARSWKEAASQPPVAQQILELPVTPRGAGPKSWGLQSVSGLETCLAFARTRPLSLEAAEELTASFSKVPAPREGIVLMAGPHQFGWSEPAAVRIDFNELPVVDPVAARHATLQGCLGVQAVAVRGVSFVNAG